MSQLRVKVSQASPEVRPFLKVNRTKEDRGKDFAGLRDRDRLGPLKRTHRSEKHGSRTNRADDLREERRSMRGELGLVLPHRLKAELTEPPAFLELVRLGLVAGLRRVKATRGAR